MKIRKRKHPSRPGRTPPIITLDMARQMGHATWNGKRLVASGSTTLGPVKQHGEICLGFKEWLDAHPFADKPKLCVFWEMPVTYGNRSSEGVGFRLEGIVMAWCEERGLKYHRVPIPTLKFHCTGYGRSSKDEVMEAEKERWGFWPSDDNESDALSVLHWALDEAFPIVRKRRKKP